MPLAARLVKMAVAAICPPQVNMVLAESPQSVWMIGTPVSSAVRRWGFVTQMERYSTQQSGSSILTVASILDSATHRVETTCVIRGPLPHRTPLMASPVGATVTLHANPSVALSAYSLSVMIRTPVMAPPSMRSVLTVRRLPCVCLFSFVPT